LPYCQSVHVALFYLKLSVIYNDIVKLNMNMEIKRTNKKVSIIIRLS